MTCHAEIPSLAPSADRFLESVLVAPPGVPHKRSQGFGEGARQFPSNTCAKIDWRTTAGDLFRILYAIGHFGALGFGVAMVSLFLVNPHRLVPVRVLWLMPLVFGSWWLASDVGQVLSDNRLAPLHAPE